MLIEFFSSLTPVLVCTSLGWILSKRTRLLDSPDLGQLVMVIGLPSLLLNSLLKMDADIAALSQIILAAGAMLVIAALLAALALRICGQPMRFLLPVLVNPNTGNLGIPVVFALLGPDALPYAVLISTTVGLSNFTFGAWLMSGTLNPRALLTNGSIMALLVGIVLLLTDTQVPVPLLNTLDMLAGITVPIMLLLLGRSLGSISIRTLSDLKLVGCMSAGRVLIGFIAAFAAIQLLPLPEILQKTLLIQSCMPVAVLSYMMTTQYQGPKDQVAAIIMLSTPLSLLAIMLLSAFYL
ncbi:auxin efflux carrier [Marinobacterium aestuarii]|uniref:Auxin efflux carrier n=1 Tax=Marinobacterium aestuarii TaxID=1821621 RepID=A0A1A9EZN5_9GAMM|nr:AEC family transporter [Marinobacterium aestuarii]ANG63121.1 auxin efflux carrier [Marinobacterium aestuarii]